MLRKVMQAGRKWPIIAAARQFALS